YRAAPLRRRAELGRQRARPRPRRQHPVPGEAGHPEAGAGAGPVPRPAGGERGPGRQPAPEAPRDHRLRRAPRGQARAAGRPVRALASGAAGRGRAAGAHRRAARGDGQLPARAGYPRAGQGPGGGGHGARRADRGGPARGSRAIPAGGAMASGVVGHRESLLLRHLPGLRGRLSRTRPATEPLVMASRKRTAPASAEQKESTLLRWLKERRITEVECLVPDFTGNARGKIIPAAKFSHDFGTRLPEGIFATTVTGDYPDEYDDLVSPSDSDMALRPDPETARMVPSATDPTAQIIHDCYTKDGRPHELAPRNVLRRVLRLYEDLGLRPVMAPELEFFLVQRNTDPDFPLQPPAGRNGRPETARQSYSIDAVNEFDPILDLMYDYCEAMELDVDTLVHESGAAQLEVNFIHADPLSRADQVFLFKRTMREAAMRHGIYATFLAKPMENEPGSSMHIHQSLVDARTGRNVFAGTGKNKRYSDTFMHYIGGLQKYVPAAMAFFGPNVNSYRRLAF